MHVCNLHNHLEIRMQYNDATTQCYKSTDLNIHWSVLEGVDEGEL